MIYGLCSVQDITELMTLTMCGGRRQPSEKTTEKSEGRKDPKMYVQDFGSLKRRADVHPLFLTHTRTAICCSSYKCATCSRLLLRLSDCFHDSLLNTCLLVVRVACRRALMSSRRTCCGRNVIDQDPNTGCHIGI